MNEKKVILRVEHLSKNFKIRANSFMGKAEQLHALSDVTLEVYEGETLGIIGESGCGKSTLGKCIVRLHEASGGDILYDEQSITGLSQRDMKPIRRDLQMIFQDPYSSLNPRKMAGDIIEEPMIIHKTVQGSAERKEIVLKLMQEVGLDVQHVHRYPHEFSGGQRQRINVARALALNPKVIVCDEPVSALDVSVQAQVLNLLDELQEKYNLTYLFISHDLGVIKHISDRIAIMYLGRVVELCKAEMIYEHPLHPYTKALLSAIPPDNPYDVREEIELQGEIPSPIGDQIGCPLAGRCPYCMDICKENCPQLLDMGDGHKVACFLYKQELNPS